MQIYLTSHNAEADLVALVQETLAKQQLQDAFTIEVLPTEQQDVQKIIDPATVSSIVTVLAIAVSSGGALAVGMGKDGALTHLAKALEALVNRKVAVKLHHNGTNVELDGSAGSIEKLLKNILK